MPPAYETASTSVPEPVRPVSPVNEWGPYDQPQEVVTPHGTYGVPVGTVLHFEQGEVWDPKQGKTITTMLPVYTKVRLDSDRLKPNKLPRHFNLGDRIANQLAGPLTAGAVQPPAAPDPDIAALKETVAAQQAQIEALLDRDQEQEEQAPEPEPADEPETYVATGTVTADPPPEPVAPANDDGAVPRPPEQGAGASKDAWLIYAGAHGIVAGFDMSRDDIVAACVEAGV